MKLTGNQLALSEALRLRDPRMQQMYLGAISALTLPDEVESLCLAAHEVRELMEKLPQVLDIETPAHKEKLGGKVRDLQRDFSTAMKATILKPPEWTGEVDGPLATFLQKCAAFFEWLNLHQPRRRDEVAAALRALDGPGRTVVADLEARAVSSWIEMRDFFVNVAHHQVRSGLEEFSRQLRLVEDFLLQKLSPRTFADFDDIDKLVDEAENQ